MESTNQTRNIRKSIKQILIELGKKLQNDLNPKIRNTDGGVFVCQNTQKNLK